VYGFSTEAKEDIVTQTIRRLIIDALMSTAVSFVIRKAFQLLEEDLDAMKKHYDEEESL
jgi:hypothetical protein